MLVARRSLRVAKVAYDRCLARMASLVYSSKQIVMNQAAKQVTVH